MSNVEKYNHHGVDVHVLSDVKGKHRDYCLCFNGCKRFKPESSDNCEIAASNFANCVKYNTVQPVFECPKFER